MKTKITLLFLSLICLSVIACQPKKPKKRSYEKAVITDAEIDQLQDGDIILRRGFGMASNRIVYTLKEPIKISHCGVVIKDKDSTRVVHCTSSSTQDKDGVQAEEIKKFVHASHKNSLVITRPKADPAVIEKLVERTEYYLSKKIPFDFGFDHDDTSQFYCTELLMHVFNDAYDKPIEWAEMGPENDKVLTLQQFYDPNLFDVVIDQSGLLPIQ